MAKLCQVIAVHTGVKASVHSIKSELYKRIQKTELFSGFAKTYARRDEEGEELPPEHKKVQQSTREVLQRFRDAMGDLWGTTARLEWGNCSAKAEIRVENTPLVTEVPVTYLLFLEKELTDLRTFVRELPTLDITEDWQEDLNTGNYKTTPVQTHRTKKIQRALVMYDATPEHPAQTQLITEDVLAGYWSTVKHSGAISLPEKEALAKRVETVLRAVKEAREGANSTEEPTVPDVGNAVLGYIFGTK